MDNDDTKAWIRRRNADVRAKRLASASPSRTRSVSSRPDGDAVLKGMAGSLAEQAGILAGAARGAAQGAAESAQFAKNLLNPLYGPLHGGRPAGLSQAQAADSAVRKGWSAAHHPIRAIEKGASQANVALNSFATPTAPTVAGEMRRRFDIGENQGRIALDVGMTALAPEGMAPPFLSAETQVAQRMARGMGEPMARYLAEPYFGMGHHYIPRRGIAGIKLPKALSDSPLNVLKPRGISRGDMHELHYEVDPNFHGARLANHIGKGWSGKAQGLEKDRLLVRVVRGAPMALKQTVSGMAGGFAGVVQSARRKPKP